MEMNQNMIGQTPIEYVYRQKLFVPIVGVMLFGFGTKTAYWEATSGTTDTVLGIHLVPSQAIVFHWFLAGGSLLFFLMAIFFVYMSLTLRRSIRICGDSITLPKYTFVSSRHINIPYSEIRKIKLVIAPMLPPLPPQRNLRIYTDSGWFLIIGSMLPRRKDFDELLDILRHKCKPGVIMP